MWGKVKSFRYVDIVDKRPCLLHHFCLLRKKIMWKNFFYTSSQLSARKFFCALNENLAFHTYVILPVGLV